MGSRGSNDTVHLSLSAFLFASTSSGYLSFFARASDFSFAGMSFHVLAYGFVGIFALAVAISGYALSWDMNRPWVRLMDYISALLMGLGTWVCCGFLSAFDTKVWILAGCGAACFGIAWLCLRWGSSLCKLDTEMLFKVDLLSVLPGWLVMMAMQISLQWGSMACLTSLAVPVMSAIALHRADRVPAASHQVLYGKESLAGFKGIVVAMGAYGCVLGLRGFLNYGYDQLGGFPSMLVTMLVVCFAWVWIFRWHRGVDFDLVFRAGLVFFAVCVFFAPLTEGVAFSLLGSLMGAIVMILMNVFVLLCAYVTGHSRLFPFTMFGLFYGLYGIPRLLINGLGTAVCDVSYLGGDGDTFLHALILLVLVVAVAFALVTTSPGFPPIFGDYFLPKVGQGEQGASHCDSQNASADRFFDVGSYYGLTTREVEVMRLLCHGRSKSYIADTLYVSENTVRAYTKSLYAKLDIHSKQDLIDIVERFSEESSR